MKMKLCIQLVNRSAYIISRQRTTLPIRSKMAIEK